MRNRCRFHNQNHCRALRAPLSRTAYSLLEEFRAGLPADVSADLVTALDASIGLAMVRQLIHGNGGTVRYAKSVSAGARFIISF